MRPSPKDVACVEHRIQMYARSIQFSHCYLSIFRKADVYVAGRKADHSPGKKPAGVKYDKCLTAAKGAADKARGEHQQKNEIAVARIGRRRQSGRQGAVEHAGAAESERHSQPAI
jgi:hypothetical protein